MSDNYNFDIDAIKDVKSFSQKTVKDLEELLKIAKNLKDKVDTCSGWKGKQKDELMTFLTLLIKYHSDLVNKSDAPFKQYNKAFDDLYNNLESYKANSSSYRELNNK